MSDTGQAGGNGAAGPTELTEAQVVAGIEGLLDDRPRREPQPQRQQNQPAQRASDVPAETEEPGPDPRPGPEDPAPSEEDDDYTPDPDAVPQGDDLDHQSVEPPKGLNAQEADLFRQLPPEAQAMFARRESDRDKAFTQKTQEIAEHRKALESTFSEIQSERQSYAENLEQLLHVAVPEAQKFGAVDWQRLASEQPAEYVRLSAEREALRGRIGAIQQEIQRVKAQAAQQQAQQIAVMAQAEHKRLVEAMPDFGDSEKGPKLAGDMRQWLQKQGFSDQEIGQVIDHRVILVAAKAMQADRALAARQAADAKRNAAAAPAVQPPGAARQRSDTQVGQRRQQKMAALRRSGSEKDAIALLMDYL